MIDMDQVFHGIHQKIRVDNDDNPEFQVRSSIAILDLSFDDQHELVDLHDHNSV